MVYDSAPCGERSKARYSFLFTAFHATSPMYYGISAVVLDPLPDVWKEDITGSRRMHGEYAIVL